MMTTHLHLVPRSKRRRVYIQSHKHLYGVVLNRWDTRLWVFTVMKFEVAVPCVVTLFSDVVGYQRFRGPCCLHLRGVRLHGVVLK